MGLFTLIKANLVHRKGNYISIFILMLLFSAVLTSSVSIKVNVDKQFVKSNEEVETGDLVLYIDADICSNLLLSTLDNLQCVQNIRTVDALKVTNLQIQNERVKSTLLLSAYDGEASNYKVFNKDINGFIEKPQKLQKGEIYLPLVMQSMYPCKIGDKITIQFDNHKEAFIIAGFIQEPLVGSNVIELKNLFISLEDFQELSAEDDANVKVIHLDAGKEYQSKIDEFEEIVNAQTQIIDYSFFQLTRQEAQIYTLVLTNILCGVLYNLLLLLIVIVVMVLSNNIGTSIEIDYVNWGILKSQGVSYKELRMVLMLQFFLPIIAGAIIGLFFSKIGIFFLRMIFIKTSCLLVSGDVQVMKSMGILLIILFFLGIFIYLNTSNISKISPIKAINGGKSDIYFSSIFRTSVLGKPKALIGIRLAMRQFTSNTRQYTRTCLILALLVCYLSTTYAFMENFNETFYDELYGVSSADVCIDYGVHWNKCEEVEKTINAISPIVNSFAYGEKLLTVEGVPFKAQIIDDSSYIEHITEGTRPVYDNEILLTRLVSRKIDKKIGDVVTVKWGGHSHEFVICGIYDSIQYVGNTFTITFDGAQAIHSTIVPEKKYYIIEDSTKAELINQTIDKNFGGLSIWSARAKKQSESTVHTVMQASDAMISFMFGISILFAIIVIWMVCNRSFLRERMDIGIYKAYGFTSRELKLQFCFRYLLITSVGSMIGTLLYYFVGDALNTTTLMEIGITQFDAPMTLGSILIPVVAMHVFVMLVLIISLRKINIVSTRELIVE